MRDLLYPIFFAIAFTVIGSWMIQAWNLWDSRIAEQIQRAAVLR